MKKMRKRIAMVVHGFSTFSLFPYGDSSSTYSKNAEQVTQKAWNMTGDAMQRALDRRKYGQEKYSAG